MESNGNCKIEHSKSTTRKQRTEGSVFLLQPFGNSQQYSSRQETKHGTEGFINPVFINGILYKEAYTDYKYKDTNLPEKVLTDEFFIVHLLLLFRNSRGNRNNRSSRSNRYNWHSRRFSGFLPNSLYANFLHSCFKRLFRRLFQCLTDNCFNNRFVFFLNSLFSLSGLYYRNMLCRLRHNRNIFCFFF